LFGQCQLPLVRYSYSSYSCIFFLIKKHAVSQRGRIYAHQDLLLDYKLINKAPLKISTSLNIGKSFRNCYVFCKFQ
jgi:hypothetical protein